jgi:SPP1 family predicted phage head-tail adaptor
MTVSIVAGKLNCRVIIKQPAAVQDAAGQPIPTWTTLATVWANIRSLNGLETIKGGAEASVAKASIRIRYRTDVTAAMRVVHGSTTYEIKAVLPDEAGKQYLDLACQVIT